MHSEFGNIQKDQMMQLNAKQ